MNALALATIDTFIGRVSHLDAETLLRSLPSDSVDLVVTSPPYDNLRTYKGYSWDFEAIARQLYRVTKRGGVVVWVVGDETIENSETLSAFEQAIYFRREAGFNLWDTMIWHKQGAKANNHPPRYMQSFEYMFVLTKGVPQTFHELTEPNKNHGLTRKHQKRQRNGEITQHGENVIPAERRLDNVWSVLGGWMHTTKDKLAFQHPAIMHEKIAERHLLSWSNAGDVVLDPFGGSGTTALMARANGRRYITGDISREYCDLMGRRLAKPFDVPLFAVA
jgi:DNA modification methylase